MSTCPTKDLLSVYLDNELPEIYKAEYEAHIKSCPKCSQELEKLKALRGLFQADAKAITPDSHYLDQSYERLMIKMKYSKVASSSKKIISSNKFNFNKITYVATAIAAAAVFALVIPLGLKLGSNSTSSAPANIASIPSLSSNIASDYTNNISLNSGRSVLISGNIEKSVLSSVNRGYKNNSIVRNISNTANASGNMIKDVEVFRPDFADEETISIRVTVPGMNSSSVVAEFEMPVTVILGKN
ncbi:MAG: zf-HC2 domain-containing protein [Treponema sp.]|nr:zf-HC2 domain-containing protein [Treponema sp.]